MRLSLLAAVLALFCQMPATAFQDRLEKEEEPKPEKDPPIPANYKALNKQKTLFIEIPKEGQRRIHLLGEVCLREGALEVFLCKQFTKEHEGILSCDVKAQDVHQALLVAGAEPGSPVKFEPKYTPASGTKVKVTITYYKDGKLENKPAQYWIKDLKAKQQLALDWVFPGSKVSPSIEDPKQKIYHADASGEIISLSNFPDSMMDVPFESTDRNGGLLYEAWTERIPPRKTKVLVTLEPVIEKKK